MSYREVLDETCRVVRFASHPALLESKVDTQIPLHKYINFHSTEATKSVSVNMS